MMRLLDKPKTNLRILHLEDDKTCQETFKKIAKSKLNNLRIKSVSDSLKFYCQLPFENPHILIVDWFLEDGAVNYLLEDLKKFKGKVIFFSSMDKFFILTKVAEELGTIPENFSIYTKSNCKSYFEIVEKIRSYAQSIGKDLD
jgi:hypothetical protein